MVKMARFLVLPVLLFQLRLGSGSGLGLQLASGLGFSVKIGARARVSDPIVPDRLLDALVGLYPLGVEPAGDAL